MAMNKKEKALLDQSIRDAKVNRALRWSDGEFKPDVPPPSSMNYSEPIIRSGGSHTRGWMQRFWCGFENESPSRFIGKGISSSISHGCDWVKTSSQNPMALHSTRLRALKALRQSAEMKFAKFLADVDEEIAKEEANPHPHPTYYSSDERGDDQ
jgi:hypothetical protein